MSDHILVEQDGPIATVVFNRPKMRNAISLAMWSEIAVVTDRLAKDDAVRAIVYRGAGTDAFASGADISEFQENRKDTATGTSRWMKPIRRASSASTVRAEYRMSLA